MKINIPKVTRGCKAPAIVFSSPTEKAFIRFTALIKQE